MGAQMPRKYVAEMVMDRISASRTYLGESYTNREPLKYFLKSKEKLWFIHPKTKRDLEALLRILSDHGEACIFEKIGRRCKLEKIRLFDRWGRAFWGCFCS